MLNHFNYSGNSPLPCAALSCLNEFRRKMRQVILFIFAISAATIGCCQPSGGIYVGIFDLPGEGMNDVTQKMMELPEKYGDVSAYSLDFSPNGEYLAASSNNQDINIWKWRDGKIIKTLTGQLGEDGLFGVQSISFNPSGKLFAACHSGADAGIVIRVWNTDTWSINHDIVDKGANGSCSIKFSPDGATLYRSVNRVDMPGDNFIAYATNDWHEIWSINLKDFTPNYMAISPKGDAVALLGKLSIVPPGVKDLAELFRLSKSQPQLNIISVLQRKVAHVISCKVDESMIWSGDGNRLILNGANHYAVYDASSGAVLNSIDRNNISMRIRSVSNGRYFIESNGNGEKKGFGIKIWSGRHDKLLQQIFGNVDGLAISRDGNYLSAGFLGRIVIWQLK